MRSILIAFVFTLVLSEIHCFDVTVCENDNRKLSCEEHQTLHIVEADYGRSQTGVCKTWFMENDSVTNCKSENALDTTRQECEGFPSCTVYANNGEYGEPCPLIKKYLTVSYQCVKAKENMLQKVRVCEGGHQLMQCPGNRKIDVEYAMYGRLKGDHVCGFFSLLANCQAEKSLDVVKNDCQGKQSCILYANNHKFGDPCFLTKKYLEVQYRCRK
ncbi:L-rhamnose-binding lectin CSL3-like [Oculina patagonica]